MIDRLKSSTAIAELNSGSLKRRGLILLANVAACFVLLTASIALVGLALTGAGTSLADNEPGSDERTSWHSSATDDERSYFPYWVANDDGERQRPFCY